jgi:hypothetical protein
MGYEQQRPGGQAPGAGIASSGKDGNKPQHNYRTSPALRESLPCTCHEHKWRPCRVCVAWLQNYEHTRAAARALDGIAAKPLHLIRGAGHD